MSDFIPLEIQQEIIKRVPEVKSLARFRSVAKSWKCFIDSPEFISGYGTRITEPPRFILRYIDYHSSQAKFICYVDDDDDDDDDNDTFTHQKEFDPIVPPLIPLIESSQFMVGISHGLWCFFTRDHCTRKEMVVIWNPSLKKSVGIPVVYSDGIEFAVNNDPTIVKISTCPWGHAEVFTLSSGVWSLIPEINLPCEPLGLDDMPTHVVIDRFIYWAVSNMILSFDLFTKQFKEVTYPNTLTNLFAQSFFSISKLRDSLILCGESNEFNESWGCNDSVCVRLMVHDGVITSFTKLFTISTPINKILGFQKSGEVIMETEIVGGRRTLTVYDPCSHKIKDKEIDGNYLSFFMGSYKETLHLLDRSDGYLFSQN